MAGLQADDKAELAAVHEAAQREIEAKKEKVELDHVSSNNEDELVADGIHDGLVFPTEGERLTLRRVSDRIPWAAYRMCFHLSFGWFL